MTPAQLAMDEYRDDVIKGKISYEEFTKLWIKKEREIRKKGFYV